MKNKSITGFVVSAALIFSLSAARAEVPGQINYQGFLIDDGGVPVDGDVEVWFLIYDEEIGGSEVWSEGPMTVPAVGGVINVILGETTPLTPALLAGPRWLEVIVEGEYLGPRERIVSSLFAIEAENADTVDGAEAADLEESAEIDADIAAHTGEPSAHHARYMDAEAVSACDAAGMEESAEIDVDIAAHASAAHAHHTKTTSFTELTDTATDAQIPNGITILYAEDAGTAAEAVYAFDAEQAQSADYATHAATADDADTVDGYEASEIIGASSGEPRTPILSAPYSITEPGSYYVTQNLSVAGAVDAISVEAENVTIDLNGFVLSGDGTVGSEGIFISLGRRNVTVKNGTITGFYDGITDLNPGDAGHTILNVRAVDNINYGISLPSSGNQIHGCIVIGNEYGINVGYGSIVNGNTCRGNNGTGLSVDPGSRVIGNTVSYNIGPGIVLDWGSMAKGNSCRGNNGTGLSVGSGSTVIGNTVSENIGMGIWLDYSCMAKGNSCSLNGLQGIWTNGGSTLLANTCKSNGDDGIFANQSTVKNNTVITNGDYGIEVAGESLVDGNTAYNNFTGNISSCASCTFGLNHAPVKKAP